MRASATLRALALAFVVGGLLGVPAAASRVEGLEECLAAKDLVRVARVLAPGRGIVYARVTAERDGHIARATAIAPDGTPLLRVFERARRQDGGDDFPVSDERVCAVVELPEAVIDAETRVIVSTGLNYAAHAEEAGGGDIFLFPKPAPPTRPYAPVYAPDGVTLLDYEVELAFVLLEDVDLGRPLPRDALLRQSAFFLSNDVSDREAIVRNAAFAGPGTGFVEGKGQPGFFPAGPWMVRGDELFAAVEACGGDGLGLQLQVDDESQPRQDASTARMILPPDALVARIGSWVEENGLRTPMPFVRDGRQRFYPLAVPSGGAVPSGEDAPPGERAGAPSFRLSAGSIVQTGTPEGVALKAPGRLGVALRGALHLRSPFEQFVVEEKARLEAGGSGYLVPGSVVRARIDGLGAQQFEIGEAGGRAAPHPCDGGDRR